MNTADSVSSLQERLVSSSDDGSGGISSGDEGDLFLGSGVSEAAASEARLLMDGGVDDLRQKVQLKAADKAYNDRIDDAALYLFEGRHYLKFRFHPTTERQRKAFRRIHYSPWQLTYNMEILVAVLLLCLSIFEEPERKFS